MHKVLIEDLPTIIDLNNGFILSYTHCESDIVIVQYDEEIKLIKKIIEQKYLKLKGKRKHQILDN